MDGANREILKCIRKTRDRMHMTIILEHTVKAAVPAFGIYLFFVIMSRFIPVYNVYTKGAIFAVALILLAFVISLFMTPKEKAVAMMLDSKGLKERTLTAIEMIGDNSPIGMLQKQDALKYLKKLDINKEIKIKFPKKPALISAVLLASIVLSAFIPNPMNEKAVEIFNFKKEMKEQEDEIEKLIKRVENNNKLTMEQKNEAKAVLEELKKELNKVKDKNEGEKALERSKNKIAMVKDKYTDKDLDKIINAFSKNEMTKSLSEILKRGDIEKLKSELEKTAEELKNLSEEEIDELSQSLSNLADSLEQSPELAEAFYDLAQKMAEGALGDLEGEISQLDNQISQLMKNDEFKTAMEDVMKVLKDSHLQGQNQNGQGQNSQSGQNQGQSNSDGGNNAGVGTGQSNQKQSSQKSGDGLGNKQPSNKDVREYEKIFTPNLLGGEGERLELQGKKNWEGERQEYTVKNGLKVKGEMKPYNQVIGQYKEKAFQNIEGRQIPKSMESVVKDYFSSLED